MKIRTLSDLSESLETDLSWRRKEMIFYDSLLEKFSQKGVVENVLRGSVPLLYAHWEGFLKTAFRNYLELVRRKVNFYGELSSSMLLIELFHKFGKSTEQEIIDFFNNLATRPVSKNFQDHVDFEGNLNSIRLKKYLRVLAISDTMIAGKEKLIDESLLATRNGVAHGRYLAVDRKRYQEIRTIVVKIMEDIKTELENAAVQGKYLA
ncbi:MAG: hypothetical protein KF713_15670 [Turneriella sp.]|nr:hypothetical protein [Turneriella sp.]